MNVKMRRISAGQLIFLLFVSRMFTLLTFTPQNKAVSGSTSLLTVVIAAVVVMAAGVFALAVQKRSACGVLEAAGRLGGGLSQVISMAFGLFCIGVAATTILHFCQFMTSAVFPNAAQWVFVICLTLAGTYAARLGLEPIARLGLPVFLLTLVAGAVMAAGLWRFIRWEQVASPLYDGWEAVAGGVWSGIGSYAEVVLFIVLVARTRDIKASSRAWFGGISLAAVVNLALTLIVLTTLGEYAGTRQFPLHTASAAAEIGPFGRLDVLYLFLWVFTAFLRTAAYLYAGSVCLGELAPKKALDTRAWMVGGTTGGLCVAAVLWQPLSGWLRMVIYNGLWLGLLAIAVPIILLFVPNIKTPPKEAKI